MDFYKIREKRNKNETSIYPDFLNSRVQDLLVKGKDFYAVWDESKGLWSRDIEVVSESVDRDLWDYAEKLKKSSNYEGYLDVKTMESDASGSWNRFCQYLKRRPDCEVQLDEKLTFLNTEVKKEDYVSKRLPYELEEGDYSAWDKLVGRLYSPEEREKIEWAIGAVVSGDSKKIQKFCVFYGDPGTGKGTIIDIIQKLFPGYYTTFNARALGSSSNQFATEVFRSNPLVAIQHDGDLSRIEDNTQLNSIISHEEMVINEKGKSQYTSKMNCFLFMGTNRPVKITDAKSGIIRRLIDISPTGKKFTPKEYDTLMTQIDFELGAIAQHCLDVYRSLGKNYYSAYRPIGMVEKTDVFFNFVEANGDTFIAQSDGMSLKQAYSMYKDYCENSYMEYKMPMYKFREELKSYYDNFERLARIDGKQIRSWYSGFRKEKLEPPVLKKEQKSLPMVLDSDKSLLDDILADCPAQYAVVKEDGSEVPGLRWAEVTTKLRDLDTKKLHYILPKPDCITGRPSEKSKLIMVDFDIRNKKGEKDMLLNLEAACKFPLTYAEFSKGGQGIHLIYWYEGDISKLAVLFGEGIEVKTFRGNASMRRRLSKCNELPIAIMPAGGLPMKEEKMIDIGMLKDEMHLRNIIKKSLRKEIHGATRPEVDMIMKALDDAYASGISYDVSDMENDILLFAMGSTNQSDYCVKQIPKMKWKSKDRIEQEERARKEAKDDEPIVFFDIEIYPPGIDSDGEDNPGLFLICWKVAGEGNPVVPMINPKPHEVEELVKSKLVGFNNRGYDNHILYGRILGYSNAKLYDLSRRMIVEDARDAKFPDAYDISYTDVYDFSTKKQSLKKWEIELGISHIEMGIPWDQPAPKSMWDKIVEYCSNDVLATEAVFNACHEDWIARQILSDLADGKVNDTTNSLTLKIVFGKEKKPTLIYTDLATGEQYEGR